jgi:hypothetical protein
VIISFSIGVWLGLAVRIQEELHPDKRFFHFFSFFFERRSPPTCPAARNRVTKHGPCLTICPPEVCFLREVQLLVGTGEMPLPTQMRLTTASAGIHDAFARGALIFFAGERNLSAHCHATR